MANSIPSKSLEELVRNELLWDPQVSLNPVGVATEAGSVRLTGEISSYVEKLAAERAAWRVHGVREVVNALTVSLDHVRPDRDVAKDGAAALRFDMTVPPSIKATVRDGHVTLAGTCDWHYQRDAAEHVVSRVVGVTGVTNAVTLTPPASTGVLRCRIEDALRRDAEIDARDVSVSTVNGHVCLSGAVRSYAERAEAARTAWASPGVTTVENDIVVVPDPTPRRED